MKRWINWIALVVVFTVACGFLANWQLSRREAKLASINLVTGNYKDPIVAVDDMLDGGKFNLPESTWRRVSLVGYYQAEEMLLVRNRPNNGQPGFEQLVPFTTLSGKSFLISRGWIPTGSNQDLPDIIPAIPSETVTVVGRILPSEPVLERGAPQGQIASINPALASQITDVPTVTNGYLRLVTEESKYPKDLTKMPSPSIEEGNNLSYALQWVLFALMAMSALFWRIRRDRELETGVAKAKKKSRAELDAEAED
jgi:cytochrome oxidase assembly protein ShyY1